MRKLSFLQFVEAATAVLATPGVRVAMRSCPRYERCSIPVCPLDTRQGRAMNNDTVCTFVKKATEFRMQEAT